MSSDGFPRLIPKRRRTAKESLLLDLNSPPVEGPDEGGLLPVTHHETVVFAETPQLLVPAVSAESRIGMHSFPIDVETIHDDNDVVIYSSRSSLPRARRQSITMPVTVIIDDDSETVAEPAGEALDEHVNTLLSLGMNPRHARLEAPNNHPVITISDVSDTNSIVPTVMVPVTVPLPAPEPVKVVPRELNFTCPVCMDELVNASSTICGHIFCEECIRAAIHFRKKCPTCRRKLTKNKFHRIYLPTSD